jgi:uncharacterized protein (TIGR03083 family)
MTRGSAVDTDLMEQVAAQRRDLAEMLAGLPAADWEIPSLCAGWRVREVVAHITMPFRYSPVRFMTELARSGGRFGRMADRCARRDAQESISELAAALRDNVRHPWQPPGGGLTGALTHDLIHGLDITVALGLDQPIPAGRLRMVLDSVTSPRAVRHFGAVLDGVELRADDLDWSYGAGLPLSGPARHLALVICGRTLPPDCLHGDAAARYSSAAA